jgi:LPPG:FO 2-phospho-L-lactate transferase
MNIVALAGGVGGAKLADGLAAALPPSDLTVVVNTADDFEHLGLAISPDLDTVVYTLAGVASARTGWGRAGETWSFLEALRALGGPTWFRLGDKDLATHVERTRRLRQGEPLSRATRAIRTGLGVRVEVLPMSDDPVRTVVETDEGDLPFQEYFVARQCQPRVRGFRFMGADTARPAPGVMAAITQADAVVLCPSNPWVSLDPILAVSGIRQAASARPTLAVSSIVGGRALKGPAAKMFQELGIQPSATAIGERYKDLLSGLVIDRLDSDQEDSIRTLGIEVLVTDTVMKTRADRRLLAEEVVAFAGRLAGPRDLP